jgi:hypothetical protein
MIVGIGLDGVGEHLLIDWVNWLTVLLVRILERIFSSGLRGSALVFILTTVEDIRKLFRAEEKLTATR